nr:hypothetical protein [Tanacetum cinerariifolium]
AVFSEDGLSSIATKLGTPIMLDSYTAETCLHSWGRSSYARTMIELRVDVELKDTIVVAMPKINGKGLYTLRVKYEWKPPRCSCSEISGHTRVECPKLPGLGVEAVRLVIQILLKFLIRLIMMWRWVPMRTSNLDKNVANSSGSSFWNIKNCSTSTTPVMDKIGKFEKLVIDGQSILVDEAGNPIKKVKYPGDHNSEDEVASANNDMALDLASERTGFGTQSLLEQWRDSYSNGDYDKARTMICMKARISLKRFKLYVISWIFEFEVARSNRFLFLLSSYFVFFPLRK